MTLTPVSYAVIVIGVIAGILLWIAEPLRKKNDQAAQDARANQDADHQEWP